MTAGPAIVFGGRGFFGRHIARAIGETGVEVLTAGRRGDNDLRTDLGDAPEVTEALRRLRPSGAVFAAGAAAATSLVADPSSGFEANVTAPMNLLEAVRTGAPTCHLILISSAAVYAPSGEPLHEASATVAGSAYGASKLAMEHVSRPYGEAGMRLTVVRAFNLVGPGQPASQVPGEFARVAAAAVERGRDSARIKVRSRRIWRDFTDVRDAGQAVALLLGKGATGTFNLCSGRPLSLGELARLTEAAIGNFRLKLESAGGPRAGDPPGVVGDPARLAAATSWSAVTDPAESVADLLGSIRAERKPGGPPPDPAGRSGEAPGSAAG